MTAEGEPTEAMNLHLPRRTVLTSGAALDALVHPVLRGLAAYWHAKRGGAALPRFKDLDPPLEIPRLTAHMSLIVVEGDKPRFRYRRMGSAIVHDRRHRQIKDATGHFADEVDFHQPLSDVIGPFTQVARTGQAYREYGPYDAGDYALLHYEWIILPLAGDGSDVAFLMTGYVTYASD
jgi:hypothetical protein